MQKTLKQHLVIGHGAQTKQLAYVSDSKLLIIEELTLLSFLYTLIHQEK
jgi:hypothetical protein